MRRELTLRVDGREIVVEVHREGERIVVEHENERHEILVTSDRAAGVVSTGVESVQQHRAPGGGRTRVTPASADATAAATSGSTPVMAPMVGVVREVHVSAGSRVVEGEKLVTMEAMKMDIFVLAPSAGSVDSVSCSVGQTVQEGQTVATISAAGA
ncbi:MAG: biotin/lipoyl-containing protein [Spirochaetales bacterium]